VKKNGEKIQVSVTISPVYDEQGRVIGASKIARDISDRKKYDEIRSRLAAIVDSADDAIVSKDLNGIVRSWNEGAQRMFGYTAGEMIGRSILRIIPKDLQYEEDEILRKLRVGERIDHYETIRLRKNGEFVEVSVTISPIRDELGVVIGASKIARDISDRKRVARLLMQSEKIAATGRMAASIAHEINNPLESVMNLVFLARENSDPESKAFQLLFTAEQELERVAHIARQTLGYYRDTGAPAEVYLHDLIDNVLTVYNSKLIGSGISLRKHYNDLQKISLRKGEMLQVFSNIIANAIHAMQDGGALDISTRKLIRPTGDGIQALVRDNGTGIPADHLPNIFEPFFTTKGDLGTGIGLWVAKQLVESRGGLISVASSTEKAKSGTTITIFLPFAVPAPRTNGEAEKGNHSSRF
jgi:PAS domain S-box-containing protein